MVGLRKLGGRVIQGYEQLASSDIFQLLDLDPSVRYALHVFQSRARRVTRYFHPDYRGVLNGTPPGGWDLPLVTLLLDFLNGHDARRPASATADEISYNTRSEADIMSLLYRNANLGHQRTWHPFAGEEPQQQESSVPPGAPQSEPSTTTSSRHAGAKNGTNFDGKPGLSHQPSSQPSTNLQGTPGRRTSLFSNTPRSHGTPGSHTTPGSQEWRAMRGARVRQHWNTLGTSQDPHNPYATADSPASHNVQDNGNAPGFEEWQATEAARFRRQLSTSSTSRHPANPYSTPSPSEDRANRRRRASSFGSDSHSQPASKVQKTNTSSMSSRNHPSEASGATRPEDASSALNGQHHGHLFGGTALQQQQATGARPSPMNDARPYGSTRYTYRTAYQATRAGNTERPEYNNSGSGSQYLGRGLGGSSTQWHASQARAIHGHGASLYGPATSPYETASASEYRRPSFLERESPENLVHLADRDAAVIVGVATWQPNQAYAAQDYIVQARLDSGRILYNLRAYDLDGHSLPADVKSISVSEQRLRHEHRLRFVGPFQQHPMLQHSFLSQVLEALGRGEQPVWS